VSRCTDAERGSATVWVVALSGVLALVGAAVVLVGAAVVARHRAGVAADFAALAAAQRAVLGDADPCAAAQRLAEANGARLVGCSAESDSVVEVSVVVPLAFGSLGIHEARARARAGPVPHG
jgi:secretion/DNA translocation related TadE-like protein